MNRQRIFGIVLVVVGVSMLIYGINATDSFADRLSDAFTGRFTERTTWYIVGGIAVGLTGLLLATVVGRSSRT